MIDKFLLRLAAARGFLAKLWALSKPYWFAKDRAEFRVLGIPFSISEGWLGRLILALIFAMNILVVYMLKLLNDWNGRFLRFPSGEGRGRLPRRDRVLDRARRRPDLRPGLRPVVSAAADHPMADVAHQCLLPRLAEQPDLLSHGAGRRRHRQPGAANRAGLRGFCRPDPRHFDRPAVAGDDAGDVHRDPVGAFRRHHPADLRWHCHPRLHGLGGAALLGHRDLADLQDRPTSRAHQFRPAAL